MRRPLAAGIVIVALAAGLVAAASDGNVVTLEAKVFVKIYDDLGWRPGYLWACDPAKTGSCVKSDASSDIRRIARSYCTSGAGRLIADKKDYPAEAPNPGTTFLTKQGDAWVVAYNGFVGHQAGVTVFKTVNCLKTLPSSPPPAPKPKPQPKPTPKPKKSSTLGLDYAMPARYGIPVPGGRLKTYTDVARVQETSWTVDITWGRKDGQPCHTHDEVSLWIDSTPVPASRLKRLNRCTVRTSVEQEGRYEVEVTIESSDGTFTGTRTILVQDWLVFGLGDSNGSGEGAPNNEAVLPEGVDLGASAVWQDRQCHRSTNSYQALAIEDIEKRDRRTSVTFAHLACSGATVLDGLIGGYEGIEPDFGSALDSQVVALRRLAGKREIDAVVISIGVNDLRFGAMVAHCLTRLNCMNALFDPDGTSPNLTLSQFIAQRVADLPRRFRLLDRWLGSAGVKPERVYLTEYFYSTRDDNEDFCNPLVGFGPVNLFTQAEAEWAYKNVLVPLNRAIEQAATDHRWQVIRGAAKGFRQHGYCAKDSWIVRLTDSFEQQLNKEGTLHATVEGNRFDKELAKASLLADFYPGDKTRAPAS